MPTELVGAKRDIEFLLLVYDVITSRNSARVSTRHESGNFKQVGIHHELFSTGALSFIRAHWLLKPVDYVPKLGFEISHLHLEHG